MKHRPLIIAHRGVTINGANNTLAAFERAIELGADMVELDVRRTTDAMVVFHDDEAGGIPVSKLTHSGLRRLSGVNVPTLIDTLELLRGRMQAIIELKESGYEEEVLALVSEHGELHRSIFASKIDQTVLRVKQLAPEVTTALILGLRKPKNFIRTRWSEIRPQTRLHACRADYAVVNWRLARFVTGPVSRAGIGVLIWTANTPKALHRYLADKQIVGLATDNLALALKLAAA
ncbi:MAG TPA: glycerophosphodiester phosphodiesterase [Candidatus Saccharimonadia bacterium]|jgi:glycerophosphoryl diester phosphodiesterase|nr:glycerophosphodiester phosphodiesterase [Candidatus Saccharimonadia bacterium]